MNWRDLVDDNAIKNCEDNTWTLVVRPIIEDCCNPASKALALALALHETYGIDMVKRLFYEIDYAENGQ